MTYLEDHDDCREPQAAFTANLVADVKKWLAKGDQVVIGIDVNDDVRSCTFSEAMGQLRLVKVITMRHGHDVPCTHNHGSKPIDGIYVSCTLRGC